MSQAFRLNNLRRWLKLKFEIDVKSAETKPALPDDVDVKRYGKKFCPSNNAVETFPNTEESRDPETISMRSSSTMPLLECVSWRGTKVSCEMSLFP